MGQTEQGSNRTFNNLTVWIQMTNVKLLVLSNRTQDQSGPSCKGSEEVLNTLQNTSFVGEGFYPSAGYAVKIF